MNKMSNTQEKVPIITSGPDTTGIILFTHTLILILEIHLFHYTTIFDLQQSARENLRDLIGETIKEKLQQKKKI